ncbi:hypothetical protein V8F33_010862 [Rhypophila sp. PSN 637]
MPAIISSQRGETLHKYKSTMSADDIHNDMILRESASIADQLLKKLAPAQPVFHHTELMPIRQNRAGAPTAQIISPKSSPQIQKPPPPQLASMRSKMHFNNNLPIPQLKDAKYLRRKTNRTEDDIDPRSGEPVSKLPSNLSHRAQTFPTQNQLGDDNLDEHIKDEFVNFQSANCQPKSKGFRPSREHIPTPGPFPYFPSQRLAPPIPSKMTATAKAAGVYSGYRTHLGNQMSAKQRRNGQEESTPAQSHVEKKPASVTGKRHPGQGVTIGAVGHITVPVIGPPPAERRWRYKTRVKGRAAIGLDAGHPDYHVQRRDSEPLWEEVQVRGGHRDGHGQGGVIRAYTT